MNASAITNAVDAAYALLDLEISGAGDSPLADDLRARIASGDFEAGADFDDSAQDLFFVP